MKAALLAVTSLLVVLGSSMASADCYRVVSVLAGEDGTTPPAHFKLEGPGGDVLAEAKVANGKVMPLFDQVANITLDEDNTITAVIDLQPGSVYFTTINFEDGSDAKFRIIVESSRVITPYEWQTPAVYGVHKCNK